jgi:hypothetical protein
MTMSVSSKVTQGVVIVGFTHSKEHAIFALLLETSIEHLGSLEPERAIFFLIVHFLSAFSEVVSLV